MAKKFFIRTTKTKGASTLYLEIRKRTPKVHFMLCTGIDVDIATWNKVNRSPKTWLDYIATEEGNKLNKQLELIEKTINQLFFDGKVTSNEDKPVIDEAVKAIVNKDVAMFKAEREQQKRKEQEQMKQRVLGFYEYFYDGIVKGEIRHGDNKVYTQGSIKVWQSFGEYLREYCPKDMMFSEITKPFADKFSVFLEKKGLMNTTVNKNVVCFRKLCNLAAEEGINSNAVSLKVWKERAIHNSDKRTEIYLTDEEIDALYSMRLTGIKEQVRDLFVLGTLTCQRFSDYSQYSSSNFKVLDDGTKVVGLQQIKTGTYVEIPVLDERINQIAAKYGYAFPKISEQKMNRYIKLVAKELSEEVASLAEKHTTKITSRERRSEKLYESLDERKAKDPKMKSFTPDEKNEWYKLHAYAVEHNGSPLFERDSRGNVIRPKYELITSHTARRSGVTNLYKTGLFNNHEIMSISGHQTERVFEKYIKVGKEEQAKRIAAKFKAATRKGTDKSKLA